MEERITAADKAGLQVEVHAIGDRANDEILEHLRARREGERPARPALPHRARPAPARRRHPALRRARRHRLDAAVPRRRRRPLGREAARPRAREDELRLAVAARREGDARVRLGLGRRADLADPRHRRRRHPPHDRRQEPGGWFPEQKISVEEALRAYTVSAAYAGFEEKDKGSLEPGKLADFVILGADPFRVKPEEIEKIAVDATVVGGKTVYRR